MNNSIENTFNILKYPHPTIIGYKERGYGTGNSKEMRYIDVYIENFDHFTDAEIDNWSFELFDDNAYQFDGMGNDSEVKGIWRYCEEDNIGVVLTFEHLPSTLAKVKSVTGHIK